MILPAASGKLLLRSLQRDGSAHGAAARLGPAGPGRGRRHLPRVPYQRRAGTRGKYSQKGVSSREPGSGRPSPGRRPDRIRSHRRHLDRKPRGSGPPGPGHRRPVVDLGRGGHPRRAPPQPLRPGRGAHRDRPRPQAGPPALGRRGGPGRRSPRQAGHRQHRQRGGGDADRHRLGLDGRRRPAPDAPQRLGHRRGRRQARDRRVRRGRPRGLRLLPGGRALAALRRRGGSPGDPQARPRSMRPRAA